MSFVACAVVYILEYPVVHILEYPVVYILEYPVVYFSVYCGVSRSIFYFLWCIYRVVIIFVFQFSP